LIFSIEDDRWRVQPNWQPELNRLSQSQETDGPAFGSKYFFSGQNKIAGCVRTNRINHRAKTP
jgi:hypothetical protein